MALRRRREGVLSIEQTGDLDRVEAMLAATGMITDSIRWPGACYLMAWMGHEPVGAAGLEPRVSAALIRSVVVVESMRGKGIGKALVAAARKAAVTRGARELYLFSTDAGNFFAHLGFIEVPVDQLVTALSGVPQVEYYRARPDELAHEVAWWLDVSRDGVIER
jgi:N-acetylglutamate synthase-like GNAT family acetyltransferase